MQKNWRWNRNTETWFNLFTLRSESRSNFVFSEWCCENRFVETRFFEYLDGRIWCTRSNVRNN